MEMSHDDTAAIVDIKISERNEEVEWHAYPHPDYAATAMSPSSHGDYAACAKQQHPRPLMMSLSVEGATMTFPSQPHQGSDGSKLASPKPPAASRLLQLPDSTSLNTRPKPT